MSDKFLGATFIGLWIRLLKVLSHDERRTVLLVATCFLPLCACVFVDRPLNLTLFGEKKLFAFCEINGSVGAVY